MLKPSAMIATVATAFLQFTAAAQDHNGILGFEQAEEPPMITISLPRQALADLNAFPHRFLTLKPREVKYDPDIEMIEIVIPGQYDFDPQAYIRGRLIELDTVNDVWLAQNDTRLVIETSALDFINLGEEWKHGVFLQWNEDSVPVGSNIIGVSVPSSDEAIGVMFLRTF